MVLFQSISRKNKEIFGIMLLYSLFFVAQGFALTPNAQLFDGLYTIITSPAQLTVDYFALGGVGSTFLNAGLVGFACMQHDLNASCAVL